ncbi:MAG: hypothetical protein WBB67_10140 [bacterium]
MLFSERHGYKKVKMLGKEEMPDHLKTRIWNAFYEEIFSKVGSPKVQKINERFDSLPYEYLKILWNKFFVQNLQVVAKYNYRKQVSMMYESFAELDWNKVYDFIEFLAKNYKNVIVVKSIMTKIDTAFKEERSSYRVIQNLVVPLTAEEEIKEIKKVFDIPDKYGAVRHHFEKALKFFSMRPEPDYANSIKESISAVDVLVQIILGKEGTLGKLIDGLDIHPALKKAFSNLYGWTSDDAGIRHPKSKEPLSCDEPEARYMLITCSAFINYVIHKTGNDKGGME